MANTIYDQFKNVLLQESGAMALPNTFYNPRPATEYGPAGPLPMAQQTPEGRVKQRVKDMLQSFDVYWFMPATGGYGSSGVPDFVCCVFGKFLAIECKAGNNRPTALQEREMDYIREAHGTALVINEDNFDELAVYLAAAKGNHHG